MTDGAVTSAVWRRPAVLRLLILVLAAELGFAVLNISVMPVYLKWDRDFSGSMIGLVLVAFLLSEAAFKPFAGHLADKYGRRLFLILGPCLVIFTPVLTLLVPHEFGPFELLLILSLRVVDGLAAAMFWPAIYAAVGESVGRSERPQGMSLLNVCFMLGLALGLPVGGGINDLFGSRVPSFALASILFAATALLAYIFAVRDGPLHRNGGEHHEHRLADLWHSARAIPLVLALAFIVFLGAGLPMAIIKPFAASAYGLSESAFGAIVLPAALAMAALGVPIGKFSEHLGPRKAVRVGLSFGAAAVWLISLGNWFEPARNLILVAMVGAMLGVGFLIAIPAWQAAIGQIDPRKSGTYLGVVMTAQGVGAIVGAPIGGALYDRDIFWPIIGCAIFLTIGAALSTIAVPERPTEERDRTEGSSSGPHGS